MENNKDYLNSLASEIEKKPESFREEKVQKVEKQGINLNPKLLGIVAAIVLVAGLLIWFIFFRAKIEVPNFVGKTVTDLGAWAKANSISTSDSIIMTQEYSLEFDADTIISQSVNEGTKIKQDTKMTFVVSKGADPDELIDFPDIQNMELDEINDWIKKNKLTKTKVATVYSDTVEKDSVINYELKTITENNFTRSSNLTINVSKGPAPAGTVTMEDFVKTRTWDYVENWAKSKKVTVTKTESYHDEIAEGLIISQSVDSGKTIKEGESFSVVVSKGKAVTMKNLVGMTREEVAAFLEGVNIKVVSTEKYHKSAKAGTVISQSIGSGKVVGKDDVLEVTYSKGLVLLSEAGVTLQKGMLVTDLENQLDKINAEGADMFAGSWRQNGTVYSEEYGKGQIISYACLVNEKEVSCDRPLEPGARIDYVASAGYEVIIDSSNYKAFIEGNAENTEENILSVLANVSHCNVEYAYTEGMSHVKVTVNGQSVKVGNKIHEGDNIEITVYVNPNESLDQNDSNN